MDKQKIFSFYKSYKNQILNEMKEYLDMPLKNIEKIGKYEYKVYEDNIEADFIIRPKYFSDSHKGHNFFPKNTDKTFDISWSFSNNMAQSEKTPKSFLRITATAYKVLNDFIQNEQPNVIAFSGLSKGHESVYYGDVFLKRLKTIFGDEYDIITDKEASMIYIINKTVSLLKNESIIKRATKTSLKESLIYWNYPLLHPSTPINIKIKQKIKQRIIKNLYLTS
jgi:hypothetical protein